MSCLSALCSKGAQYIYKGLYALGTCAAYSFGIYYEYGDTSLVGKVSSAFANCMQNPAAACCVTNWPEVVASAHEVPMMSSVSTAVLPVLGFGLGLLAAKTVVKEPLNPEQKFSTAYKSIVGFISCTTAVAYPLTIVYEHSDSVLVTKIGATFAQCVANNATTCCINGWSTLMDQSSPHIPMMSLACTIALPILGGISGALLYKPLVAACNAKSKWDYRPLPVVNTNDLLHVGVDSEGM